MSKLSPHSQDLEVSPISSSKNPDSDPVFPILAVMGGLCIFLSAIEFVLPRPIPFFRYGLANIPILIVLRYFKFSELFTLVLIKVLGLAVLNGTLTSYVFLFSLAGSLASFFVMYSCVRFFRQKLSCVGLSVIGAFVSNLVQALLAVFVIFGSKALVILPLLIGLGMISGLSVGVFAEYYRRHSQFVAHYLTNSQQGTSGT